MAAAGVGPQDGFSGYKAFGDPPRPRWGDYGAAQFDGTNLWIASEYIGQTCTLGQYLNDPIGAVRRHPHRARQLGHADQPDHAVTR